MTTCGLAREALSLLRERKDGYDIVISDVNMPDMDGFKLLELVGIEMDLPVISMPPFFTAIAYLLLNSFSCCINAKKSWLQIKTFLNVYVFS